MNLPYGKVNDSETVENELSRIPSYEIITQNTYFLNFYFYLTFLANYFVS